MGTKTALSKQSKIIYPMHQFVLFADQLFDNWQQQIKTTQTISEKNKSVKSNLQLAALSNAKAEQVLDDLHAFFVVVKETAPDVAKHIHMKLKNKLPEIANTMFNPDL